MPVENPSTPEPNQPPQRETSPQRPEVNPAEQGNKTEVDLDKSKTKTFPDKTPPERH